MKRFLSVVLSIVLACSLTPTLAFADTESESSSPTVGTGDYAQTIEELLTAGDYIEGQVLAMITSEYGSQLMLLDAESEYETTELFTFSTADDDVMALSLDEGTDEESNTSNETTIAEETGATEVIMLESSTLSTEELLEQLADTPGVVSACPNYTSSAEEQEGNDTDSNTSTQASTTLATATNDTFIAQQWALDSTENTAGATNTINIWDSLGLLDNSESTSSSKLEEVVVAVIDTGVDATNPDLQNVLWSKSSESTLPGIDSHGYDGYGGNESYATQNLVSLHGTHVAGIIAAQFNNNEGIAGIAPNARIMALKACDENGAFILSSAITCYAYLQAACNEGVNVVAVNDSWGGFGVPVLLESIMEELYSKNDVINVVASSNDSNNNDTNPIAPANGNSEGIITVNALTESGQLAAFSDYGARTTDIAAPGYNILSTVFTNEGELINGTTVVNFTDSLIPSDITQTNSDGVTAVVQADNSLWAGNADQGTSLKWTVSGLNAGLSAAIAVPLGNLQEAYNAQKSSTGEPALAFQARCTTSTNDNAGRLLRAYIQTKNGDWELISKAGQAAGYGSWLSVNCSVSAELAEKVDWTNVCIKIERPGSSGDATAELTFNIDEFSMASSLSSYARESGTSMATPVVAGAIALLAGVYTNDDTATLRDRLLGSVSHTANTMGTCTTDGQLDLAKAANPLPVVNTVEQDSTDATQATITGNWFGASAGTVWFGETQLEVTSWSADSISVVLPENMDTTTDYLKVVRSDGEWGRHKVEIASTHTSNTADAGAFESLPTPDLDALGITILTDGAYAQTQLCEVKGTIFATNTLWIYIEDGVRYGAVLAYDTEMQEWSLVKDLSLLLDSYTNPCKIATNGDVLYMLSAFKLEAGLYTSVLSYNPESKDSAVYPLSFNDAASNVMNNLTFTLGSLTAYNSKLYLTGLHDTAYTASTTVVEIDPETGKCQAISPLNTARLISSMAEVNNKLVVVGGNTDSLLSTLATTVEVLGEDGWTSYNMPDGLYGQQFGTTALGVLPAGYTIPGVEAADHERLIVSGLIENETLASLTYVFDTEDGSWTRCSTNLSSSTIVLAGGTVYNDTFYVLGYNTTTNELEFRTLSLTAPNNNPDSGSGKETIQTTETITTTTTDTTPQTGDSVVTALALAALATAAGTLGVVARRKLSRR